MSYPKHMYKGSYDAAALWGEEKIVADLLEEKAARKAGFLDGHEFFSKPPRKIEQPERPEFAVKIVTKS